MGMANKIIIMAVGDKEAIYRSVQCNNKSDVDNYKYENGQLHFSSQIFRDRFKKPSVDRATLCNNDPTYTQVSESDGVVELIVQDVRKITNITYLTPSGPEKGTLIDYQIDVIERPEEDNDAHAQIESQPEFKSPRTFKRMQEMLAILASSAGWKILPEDLRKIN